MAKAKYTKEQARIRKRLYGVWRNMIQRCENPKNITYRNYGARGIDVCTEWHKFDEFYQWAIDNGYDGDAPQGKCTIERRNNDKGYYPWNCRWTDMMEQSWNKRPAKRESYQFEDTTSKEYFLQSIELDEIITHRPSPLRQYLDILFLQ